MKDTQTKVFGLLCVLVGVWTAVYWLYEPGEPPVSFAHPSGDDADGRRGVPVRDPMAELSPPIQPDRRPEPAPARKVEPAPTPAPAKPEQTPRTRVVPPEYWEYTVQQGDGSLEAIARRLLGDGRLWTKIAEANPLLDARKLVPGRTRLKIPKDLSNIQGKVVPISEPLPPAAPSREEPSRTAAPEAPKARTYLVKSGDTLSGISKEVYGTSALWRKIYEANTDVIDNPDAVKPGTTLRIPPKD